MGASRNRMFRIDGGWWWRVSWRMRYSCWCTRGAFVLASWDCGVRGLHVLSATSAGGPMHTKAVITVNRSTTTWARVATTCFHSWLYARRGCLIRWWRWWYPRVMRGLLLVARCHRRVLLQRLDVQLIQPVASLRPFR